MLNRTGRARSLALAALATTALAACGGSGNSSSSSASSSSPASGVTAAGVYPPAAALVPANIKANGALTVAADATHAPNEFIGPDGHTVIGLDADLAHALFPLLGLKANVVNVPLHTIIPGLRAGTLDIGLSSLTDTKASEAKVNFVDYFTAGESFFARAAGGSKPTGLAGLCGLQVAVESGTTEQADAQRQSESCTSAGKPAVDVFAFRYQKSADVALAAGRVQVAFAASPVAAYEVAQSRGRLKLVGASIANAPYGIAVPKSSGTLDDAILAALKFMVKHGQYATVLDKWGVQGGADDAPAINGATS